MCRETLAAARRAKCVTGVLTLLESRERERTRAAMATSRIAATA
ncbi:hypothetical protein DAD186_16130 [Dermabacter vaginalis]|uniref:Uncharacterized protein n=1 Tax=Dermabacter vaginalis TaxID=1630135 RepID=A0A1B0ZJR8_9MICO|nr:hypothetical protein DAD186_16130 [Dermabacter vaginalis]